MIRIFPDNVNLGWRSNVEREPCSEDSQTLFPEETHTNTENNCYKLPLSNHGKIEC